MIDGRAVRRAALPATIGNSTHAHPRRTRAFFESRAHRGVVPGLERPDFGVISGPCAILGPGMGETGHRGGKPPGEDPVADGPR